MQVNEVHVSIQIHFIQSLIFNDHCLLFKNKEEFKSIGMHA